MIHRMFIGLFCLSVFWGCENTNLDLATEAGMDVIRAVNLSDRDVEFLAASASKQLDSKNPIAGIQNPYGIRLEKLVGGPIQFKIALIAIRPAFL